MNFIIQLHSSLTFQSQKSYRNLDVFIPLSHPIFMYIGAGFETQAAEEKWRKFRFLLCKQTIPYAEYEMGCLDFFFNLWNWFHKVCPENVRYGTTPLCTILGYKWGMYKYSTWYCYLKFHISYYFMNLPGS